MSEQEELFPQFPPLPALAFRDGTSSGFSGTDTSKERAELRDLVGAVSNLHKKGLIARLAEKRGKNKIYVMPYNVDGRETETQGRKG